MLSLGLGLGLSQRGGGGGLVPALNLDFTTGSLDSRITFTRASDATRVNSSGLIETVSNNVARFDHDPVTLAPLGLLIEEQRTNLLTYSEQFDNAAWVKASATVTANSAVAPDGTTTADLVAFAGSGVIRQEATVTTSTASLWVKRAPTGSATAIRLATNNTTAWATGYGVKITLTDEWQRISASGTLTSGSTTRFSIGALIDTTGSSDADCVGNVLIWGAQLEAGAFATSYIPTVASTVTRSADLASMTGANFSSWWNAVEGTFVLEGATPGSGTRVLLSADDNTANENMEIYTSTLDPKFLVTDGGVSQADIDGGAITARTAFKIAAAYKANDFGVSVAGGAEVADTGGTIPTVDRLRLGVDQGGNYANGHVKSLAYYNTRQPTQGLSA